LRGRLVAVNQLNVVTGILVAFFSNFLIGRLFEGGEAWRWMFGVEAFPAAVFVGLLFFIPYSPRWLAKRGRHAEARAVLLRMGEPDVDRELAEIEASLYTTAGEKPDKLFQRKYQLPLFCAWALAMFNQLSGINALMYYAPKIFQMAGAGADDALFQAVIIGGTNLAFTVLALFVIDRFGRRPLLYLGSVGTAASLFLVASQFSGAELSGDLVLYGLVGFIAAFAISQGAVIWVFISEIFPNKVRSKGQVFGSFTHWFMAAAVSWTFPVLASGNGAGIFAL
jgi:sugar porter (SP) family MFS transporter